MTQARASLADWLARLEQISPQEIVLGLERVQVLIERLALRTPDTTFLIGGTNGKGSSVAMTTALLRAIGKTVGTYTSPHILRYNERICVDGEALPDDEIVDAFARIEAVRGDIPLTYFEFGTLAAMLAFTARGVEAAVLEVGMGGRLDAVNAFEPTASLITNIALDHCAWLGNDVESIAVEKAGIMRAGKPVVFGSVDRPRAIAATADSLGADLWAAGRDYRWQYRDELWDWTSSERSWTGLQPPGLGGAVQTGNAAGVLCLFAAAGLGDQLNTDLINTALTSLSLPGRMQSINAERNWLLDVAHNPAAAEALAASLSERPFDGKTLALFAMLDDKDVAACVRPLAPHVDQWIGFTAQSPRAIPAHELARRVANASGAACLEARSPAAAMAFASEHATTNDRILVTGSFFSVSPVLKALELYSRR